MTLSFYATYRASTSSVFQRRRPHLLRSRPYDSTVRSHLQAKIYQSRLKSFCQKIQSLCTVGRLQVLDDGYHYAHVPARNPMLILNISLIRPSQTFLFPSTRTSFWLYILMPARSSQTRDGSPSSSSSFWRMGSAPKRHSRQTSACARCRCWRQSTAAPTASLRYLPWHGGRAGGGAGHRRLRQAFVTH